MELVHLDKLDIRYEIILENDLNIINLLMQDKDNNYYYLIKKDDKKIIMGNIAKQINSTKLTLVKNSLMESLLNVKSGFVSIFCLLENKIDNLTVLIDSRLSTVNPLLESTDPLWVTFYDLSCSKFIKLKYQDMLKYINSIDLPTYDVIL